MACSTHQSLTIARDAGEHMMLPLSLNYYGAALIGSGDTVAARATLLEASQRALAAKFSYFLMNAFYYFAELLVLESKAVKPASALAHKRLAATLLSCVRSHSSTWQIYRDKAAQLQAEIEGEIPMEMLATAIAYGQNATLEEMVATLLEIV